MNNIEANLGRRIKSLRKKGNLIQEVDIKGTHALLVSHLPLSDPRSKRGFVLHFHGRKGSIIIDILFRRRNVYWFCNCVSIRLWRFY
jgi:hypothetical protein